MLSDWLFGSKESEVVLIVLWCERPRTEEKQGEGDEETGKFKRVILRHPPEIFLCLTIAGTAQKNCFLNAFLSH